MTRTSKCAVLLLAAVLFCVAPTTGQAGDEDDPARAAQIQEQARDALRAEQYGDAARLAGRAVELDPSLSTWLARQVQIEALEAMGRFEEALSRIEQYLDLDGLFAEHRSWGKEARQRIRDEIVSRQAAQAATAQRGVGVGLLIGGAIPLGIGVGFLANYGRLGADFETYGGWMQSGVVLLGVGAALDVVGLIVAATAGAQGADSGGQRSSVDRRVRPVLSFDLQLGPSSRVGLTVRF